MRLYRLIYYSYVPDSDVIDLDKLIEVCRRNNHLEDITGALYYQSSHFLQVLEGAQDAVSRRYNKIAQDKRHVDVTLVLAKPILERQFADWDMKYIARSSLEAQYLKKYASSKRFAPAEMSLNAVLGFLDDITGHAKTAEPLDPV